MTTTRRKVGSCREKGQLAHPFGGSQKRVRGLRKGWGCDLAVLASAGCESRALRMTLTLLTVLCALLCALPAARQPWEGWGQDFGGLDACPPPRPLLQR